MFPDSDRLRYMQQSRGITSFLFFPSQVYGKLSQEPSGTPVFHWQHSYSKYSVPSQKYRANGPYLWFGNYNVAVRDRVKVISGIEGAISLDGITTGILSILRYTMLVICKVAMETRVTYLYLRSTCTNSRKDDSAC